MGPATEMMVNDFDDERTLDEEEALEGSEDSHNELSNLQKVYHPVPAGVSVTSILLHVMHMRNVTFVTKLSDHDYSRIKPEKCTNRAHK